MKSSFAIVVAALFLSACNIHKVHEKAAQSNAEKEGLVAISKPALDASFIRPDVSLNHYKKIILKDLDFSNVKIIKPSSSRHFQEPWELTKEDKQFYQEKFAASANNNLFGGGKFSEASLPASDTLVLKTKITEIAPLASKDDFKSRPHLMDVYSEGFGRMTIVFELYDSNTRQLIMLSSDERDLGRLWERNDRAQHNMQIKLAFDYWLKTLGDELALRGN